MRYTIEKQFDHLANRFDFYVKAYDKYFGGMHCIGVTQSLESAKEILERYKKAQLIPKEIIYEETI